MSIKFLIVDDSVTMRRIVVNSLRNIGYDNFVEAGEGKEAIEKLTSDNNINFVITDWNMPGVSGLELVKSLRSNSKYYSLIRIDFAYCFTFERILKIWERYFYLKKLKSNNKI